ATGGHTVFADDPAGVPRSRGRPRLPSQGAGDPHGARAPRGGDPAGARAGHSPLRTWTVHSARGARCPTPALQRGAGPRLDHAGPAHRRGPAVQGAGRRMAKSASRRLRSVPMTPGQTFHDERSNEEDQEDVVPQKSNIIPLRFNHPGINKLLLPRPADTDSLDTSAAPTRALFAPPPETAVAEKRSSLVDFLNQVTLFEELSRWDLRHLARMSTSATTGTASTSSKKGNPARRSLSCGAAWSRS